MTKKDGILYWLSSSNISFNKMRLLIESSESLDALFYDKNLITEKEFLSDKEKTNLLSRADEKLLNTEISDLFARGIYITTVFDEKYPKSLLNISDPPYLLYYKGKIELLSDKKIAVVGTRKYTRNGFANTKNLCRELSQNGVSIVSGTALGIDSAALSGGIEGKTPCAAILGNGLDVIYPSENEELYSSVAKNGVLISEFTCNTDPKFYNFPRRNRIIAGLANGIAITHAPIKSGTANTLSHAVNQNKDVFAMPGNINEEGSELPNLLISEGAIPLTSADVILNYYGWSKVISTENTKNNTVHLDFSEKEMYTLLKQGELSMDELSAISGKDISQISLILTGMELKGLIERLPGNKFGLKI